MGDLANSPKPIPWWTPEIEDLEKDLIHQVLLSGYINEGEWTESLEKKLADYMDIRYAVATSSGTAALFLALKAVGIGHGDEVIVPDITFIASANAVTLTGASVKIIDVDPNTLNLDASKLSQAITPRTRAIMVVHVSGRTASITEILKFARDRDLAVIEDAAEALGSRLNGRCLGTFGTLGCISFSANKTLSTGQGGMVFTDNPQLAVRLRQLKDQGRATRGTGGEDSHQVVGYNFKLTNLQAAIGLGQFSHLEKRLSKMGEIYERYHRNLKGLTGIRLIGFDTSSGMRPQWTDAAVENRETLVQYLSANKIQCRKFWHPLHRQPPYLQPDDLYPSTTSLVGKLLWLPSAFTLSMNEIDWVCHHIRKHLCT